MVIRDWYSVNLPKEMADKFHLFLRTLDIRYEPSEDGDTIHFEVFASENERVSCDRFLSILSGM